MSKLRLLIIVGVIGIVLLTTFGLKSTTTQPVVPPDVRPEIGFTAPDFSLKDLNGQTVKLSDFRGKPVYINFWASWCPPCREEMPELVKFYEKNKGKVVVLTIDIIFNDKLDEVRKLLQANNATYPVLLDEDPKNGAAYNYAITGIPEHFFIDKNGIIRDTAKGPMTLKMLEASLQKAL